MKRVTINGSVQGQTTHYNRVKLEKVEKVCSECGAKTVPGKPYGTIFVPLSVGIPDEILISLKKGGKE